MESLEYSNNLIDKNKKKNIIEDDEEDDNDLIKRYEVESKIPLNNFVYFNKTKKKKLPLLFYVFILAILIFLGFLILYIIVFVKKKVNYTEEYNKIEKPLLSSNNYTNIKFENGLEILLIQTRPNASAGGSIIFDTGRLDNFPKYNYLQRALYLLSKDFSNELPTLHDYLGEISINADDYYSSISFNILNDGFFKFLSSFANLTYFKDGDSRLNENGINYTFISYNYNNIKREKLILEFLIYGCNYYVSRNRTTTFNHSTIVAIMKSLLNPKKMKIVLASHFKPSLMKKKVLTYFNKIINAKKDEKHIKDEYSYSETNLTTQKIVYYKVADYDTNYLKIIYFVEKNEDDLEFYKILGYFKYLKYILEQTNEGSLFYYLTNTSNFSIKSLSLDYEMVLKKNIQFSINIDLSPSCYEYLEDIIFITYEYINKIIKLDFDHNSFVEELKTINKQKFIFKEDEEDIMYFTKSLGIKLFNKNNGKDILKDDWIYSSDLNEPKKYFSKLQPKNSVIIIGLNNYAKEKVMNNVNKNNYLNIDYDILFNKLNNSISRTFNYSYINFTKFNKSFDENIYVKINTNSYISNYMNVIEIDKEDNNNKITKLYQTNIREFKYLKDSSFRLPKVKMILNLYHPFYRPGNVSGSYIKDCIFFEFILYLTYIQRQVNIKLADAIRAGNKITIGYNHNSIFIDVFAFSDVAQKIMWQIKEIMENDEFQLVQPDNERFELYMQSALEETLNSEKIDAAKKAKYLFYYSLNRNMYINFEFPKELNNTKIFNEKCNSIFSDISNLITEYILNSLIFGYYNKTQANEIVKLFNKTDNDRFETALENAGLRNQVNKDNFIQWITKQDLNFINNKTNEKYIIYSNDANFKRHRFIFLYWSHYSLENRINILLFNKLLNDRIRLEGNRDTITFETILHNGTYLLMHFHFMNQSKNDYDPNFVNSQKEIISENYKNETWKKKYLESVDVVGTRFYYLRKNIINQLLFQSKNMEASALQIINEDLYTKLKPTEVDLLNIKVKDEKNEYVRLFNHFKAKSYYVDIQYKNIT